jgi:hypothetical protein
VKCDEDIDERCSGVEVSCNMKYVIQKVGSKRAELKAMKEEEGWGEGGGGGGGAIGGVDEKINKFYNTRTRYSASPAKMADGSM